MKLLTFIIVALSGVLAISGRKFLQPPLNPHTIQSKTVAHPLLLNENKLEMPAVVNSQSFQQEENCYVQDLIAASGDDLVRLVKQTSASCFNRYMFYLTDEDARLAYNEADMITIAYEYYSSAYYYNPLKPADESLLQLALYLRAGFYVHFYHKESTGPYNDPTLYAYIQHGIEFFLNHDNLDATNSLHLDTFGENLLLITNADLNLELLDPVVDLLHQITYWTSWTLDSYGQATVVNSIFNIYFYLTDEKNANKELADMPEVPFALDDFMNVRANLLGGYGEFLVQNAGGELARLLQFSSIKPTVRPLVKGQISKYSMSYGSHIWINMASKIEYFDNANCAYYGTCNYKEVAKEAIFLYRRTCDVTKNDQFTIIAQTITPEQLDEVCQRLKTLEGYFHERLETNWQPVAKDFNTNLNIIIYASNEDYVAYNSALFGLDTNNGGIYIEGDPSQPGNVAEFFCYVRYDWDNNWDVWNLEHEITHYFDGRYDMFGDFYFMNSYPTVWWSEGLGEYIANKDDYYEIQRTCSDKKYSLSAIFQTTYSHGTERVYYYGYSAVRFLFENHLDEVDQLLNFFRKGKLSEYANYIRNDVGKKYDAAYSKWCDCLVKDQC